ncbi:uncharacterized protein [Palaemon carinicauda]|uniref:uncharacterized protein n=1 Tax=Palaemon carinicauda TaxID=392227 RepID=UPI0035B68EB3
MDGDQQTTIKLGGGNIKRVQKFKYLGSVIDNGGNMEEEINNRIQCGWNNWRKVSGIICDRKVPIRLKGREHKAVTIKKIIHRDRPPNMLHRSDTFPAAHEYEDALSSN